MVGINSYRCELHIFISTLYETATFTLFHCGILSIGGVDNIWYSHMFLFLGRSALIVDFILVETQVILSSVYGCESEF